VPILNEAFGPTEAEIAYARGMVETYDKALAEGVGAVVYKGKMIDVPVVERARALLDWAERIAARRGRPRA
jgi:citrate lyase subunit beta/citryl-CoA lyase